MIIVTSGSRAVAVGGLPRPRRTHRVTERTDRQTDGQTGGTNRFIVVRERARVPLEPPLVNLG